MSMALATAEGNPPLSFGALAAGVLLGAWLAACDGWVKVLTRTAACPQIDTLGDATAQLWSAPAGCTALPLGGGLTLLPQARAGATPFEIGLPPGFGPVWGLALIGIATVLSILFLRWRWRIPGDALALGTFWAGALLHALPRLTGAGATVTELQVGSLGLGVGDLGIAWGVLWLAWRFVAELIA